MVAFLAARLPVSDLNAAQARAAAASHGVGLTYWLAWFGGSAPGQYSVATPILGGLASPAAILAAATMAIVVLARPVLQGSARPLIASYAVVVSAAANLWSRRVAFAVGCAVAMSALLLLRRGHPVVAGVVNGLAALASPLAPAFLLLGVAGPAIARRDLRRPLSIFAVPSLVGMVLPALAFGLPGPMPFMFSTLVFTLIGAGAAACLPMRGEHRLGLLLAVGAIAGCYLVPNGIGSNIQRYAVLIIPPLAWATSQARARIVLLGLVPALWYCGFNLVSDLQDAAQPSAHAGYYTDVRDALAVQPSARNHRVEVVDTTTHAASAALVPAVYLARGWEVHSDAENNPIFYTEGALGASSYRKWLDANAVSLIALPPEPAAENKPEAALLTSGLPYLHVIWQRGGWRIYSVDSPTPIVESPATLVSSDQSSLTIVVESAADVTLNVRPSRFLRLVGDQTSTCLTPSGETAVQVRIPAAGTYRLVATLTVRSLIAELPLMPGNGSDC